VFRRGRDQRAHRQIGGAPGWPWANENDRPDRIVLREGASGCSGEQRSAKSGGKKATASHQAFTIQHLGLIRKRTIARGYIVNRLNLACQ
jgi:hypothetical protein